MNWIARSQGECGRMQRGQALAEGLVVLFVLLSVWVAIGWLSRFQDMALQATHASRFAAFSVARHSDLRPAADIRRRYFSGPAHQWNDRHGRSVLSLEQTEVSLLVRSDTALDVQAQPGGSLADAVSLRQGWRIDDTGIVRAIVTVGSRAATQDIVHKANAVKIGLSAFDGGYPILTRHTAILAGAGHASNDLDAQHRIAASKLGWSNGAENSYRLGRHIQMRTQPLDRAWGRAALELDWLTPWASHVPELHLTRLPEAEAHD
ncbi:hypothetical protein LSG25_03635 [Paralcaligenes sp. KSB-10]|uniref:hypothetical protein n=1 Tax=Paralcaligenes sp. KSB-10 TaxID=2901142 RepID=UPI001E65401D|nr:hypothetical protein [Paralcaligenes sp. KSB-10]UHL65004.1 hypothetical protein LSG25_03635 [Paralcaligenes sp. KSB-10]